MSTDLLFEQFATLATAPDGIARLRELILQLAGQGKLGTQDAGDEPAGKLVERIRREKERLVKEGKIKKDKPLKMSDSEEPPCLLPKTWVWTRLSEVGLVNPRNYDIADDEDVSFIPMTLIPVGYKKPAQQEIKKWGEIKAGFTHFADNDVVMAKITPCFQNGKSVVLRNLKNGVGAGTTELHVFRSIKNLMNPEYVLLFLKTPEFLETGIQNMTGTAGQKRVPNEYFSEAPFPLPPLAEQSRIVEKIDRFMVICDELEARQQKERAGCLKLGTASLAGLQNAESPEEFERQWAHVCDAFDLILDCPENVAVLRQAILQLAVQGKLGTQNPGDEPAEILAEKILREKERLIAQRKIKHEERIDQINAEDIPFDIPESWQWAKLGNLCNQITDGTHVTPKYISDGVPFLSVKNFSKGFIDFSGTKFISQETHSEFIKRCKPEMNDLILTKVGTTGIAKVVDTEKEFSIFVSLALLKISYNLIFPKYLEIALNSPLGKAQSKFYTQGMGNQNLVLKSIKIFNLPLPPLAEQHRIVAKVDALMALCDALEMHLKERAGVQERLAGAVVKQVAGGW